MRSKQHLAAIRPSGPVLILETLFFGDEVRPPRRPRPPETHEAAGKSELHIAQKLIDALTVDFDPASYTDTYRDRVLDLIEAKAKGKEIVTERRRSAGGSGEGPDGRPWRRVSPTSARPAAVDRRSGRGLADLSKEELYDRATEKSIPGRSKMSKLKLIAALEQAS